MSDISSLLQTWLLPVVTVLLAIATGALACFYLVEWRSLLRTDSCGCVGGTQGCATGRNVHQRSQPDAVNFCKAIRAIVVKNQGVDEAVKLLSPNA